MTIPRFRLVESGIYEIGREPETMGERVSGLHEAANQLAREQVEEFRRQLLKLAVMAADMDRAGGMIPVGIRDIALRLGTDMAMRAKMLDPLIQRTWPEPYKGRNNGQ
jgi:hypothetical protein